MRRAAEKVRVLYVIDQLCTLGGAERILLKTIRLLPKERYTCSLATFKINSNLPVFGDFPCPLHVFPLSRTYDLRALETAWRLRDLVQSERVQIVHTFFETSDLWAGTIAKLSGCPVLISSRRDMGILRSAKHRLAYRVCNRLFDEVHTVSEEVRKYCVERDGIRPEKVVTLYNGVDLQRIDATPAAHGLRSQLGLAETTPIVATVANIRRVKGIDTLIRAAADVIRTVPSAIFLIIGEFTEGEHYRSLQQLALDLGVAGNVRFLGPADNVISLLKACTAFCMLSRSEGLSNAVLEAMACALPCVVTRVGGNPELIENDRNGFLVDCDDSAAAAEALVRILQQSRTARSMGIDSRAVIEKKFTTDTMMNNLVRSYERLIDCR
jgi:glycosyltransferase involved in cell wall biosynthesis